MNGLVEQRQKRKVVIVGGGLVGALCACILAKRGHHVELYEARPDPRSEAARFQGRSINLALSARGRAALSRAGLEDVVLSQAIPMRGRMIHSLDGSTKTILYDPNTQQCIYSVSRQFLNEILISEADKLPHVSVHFSHKLLDSNLEKGELTFRHGERYGEASEVIKVQGDVVVGADGAHSALRRSVLKRPMTNFSQFYIDHGYMELRIPAKSDGKHAMPKNYLHIWPRNEFMLIALPNLDGSFTATLFMPIKFFGSLKDAGAVEAFFAAEFPDAMTLMGKDLLVKDFLSSLPSHLISVKCNPVNAGVGVLIGDAAHAMVPFYGQGMNAGFEDVLLLDDALERGATIENGTSSSSDSSSNSTTQDSQNVREILSEFSKRRVPDAQAICELALYNYVEMRCLVNQSGFIFRRFLDYKLYRIFGNRWSPLYNNVTFSLTPYSKCIQEKQWQDKVVSSARTCFLTVATVITLVGCIHSRRLLSEKIHSVVELLMYPKSLFN